MEGRKRKASSSASPAKRVKASPKHGSSIEPNRNKREGTPRRSPARAPSKSPRRTPSEPEKKEKKKKRESTPVRSPVKSPRKAPPAPEKKKKKRERERETTPAQSPAKSPRKAPAEPEKRKKKKKEPETTSARSPVKSPAKSPVKSPLESCSATPADEAFRKEHNISTLDGMVLPPPVTSFSKAPFSKDIVSKLSAAFGKPSPIQAQAWPLAMSGVNVLGVAQTGSGKTLAFLLPAVHLAQRDRDCGKAPQKGPPQVLVLAPTRELATQIEAESHKFSAFSSVCLYGGVPKGPQAASLRKQPGLVVATPGRLLDHVNDKAAVLGSVRFCVLDEADRMLDMGFAAALKEIFGHLPEEKQVMCFTATWPKAVQKLAKAYLADAVQICIGESLELAANKSVSQQFFQLNDMQKDGKLYELLSGWEDDSRVLVFANTKRRCEGLSKSFWGWGFGTCAMHGDKQQWEREQGLKQFLDGTSPVMFATDVAARGLDIGHISHVVNYDMPADLENYVHRIGRTGRGGRKGASITFVNSDYDMKCTPALVKIAEDACQTVPEWLQKYADKQKATAAKKDKAWAI